MTNLTKKQQELIALQNSYNPKVDWENIVRNQDTLKSLISRRSMKYIVTEQDLVVKIAQELNKKKAKVEKKAARKEAAKKKALNIANAATYAAILVGGAALTGLFGSAIVAASIASTDISLIGLSSTFVAIYFVSKL